VIAPRVMYWALRTWLVDFAVSWGLDVEFVNTSHNNELAAALRSGSTRLIWLETPANPTWEVTDIGAAVEIARSVGARVVVERGMYGIFHYLAKEEASIRQDPVK